MFCNFPLSAVSFIYIGEVDTGHSPSDKSLRSTSGHFFFTEHTKQGVDDGAPAPKCYCHAPPRKHGS